jgi:putative hydrolase of the HAD superfamily
MPVELRSYLMTAVAWFPEFDHLTFSCDLGVVKPRPEIYESCLEGLGVSPQDTLFFDDRGDNVGAAHALGIHAVLFTTPKVAMADLNGKFSLPVAIGC